MFFLSTFWAERWGQRYILFGELIRAGYVNHCEFSKFEVAKSIFK
jgi:hypothetical protein